MTTIDFTQVLKDFDGRELPKEPGMSSVTLFDVVKGSLLAYDDKMNGEEKYNNFQLVRNIDKDRAAAELESEEISKIKQAIGKMQSPIVVGLTWELLEGRNPYIKDIKPEKSTK